MHISLVQYIIIFIMDAGPGAVCEVCHYVIYDSFAVSMCLKGLSSCLYNASYYTMCMHMPCLIVYLLKYTNCVTLLQQVIKTLYALNTYQWICGNHVK